jgi:GMP synthase (glutamine-hydrolysing)
MIDSLAILDFGSQYAQLIARRVREAHVYCELFPWDAPADRVLNLQPKGFILSGGPASVYAQGAPGLPGYVIASGMPILGICYGMQVLTSALGGRVDPSPVREFGGAQVEPAGSSPLLPGKPFQAWMSHGDRITALPPGFITLARSAGSPHAAIGDPLRRYFGLQFHPEVNHTEGGAEILRRFTLQVCGCTPGWTPASIIEESIARIRERVGAERLLAAVSGGVDSSVAAALVYKAVGSQQTAIFVDTGLLRQGEAEQIVHAFRAGLGAELVLVDAAAEFFKVLKGISDPEKKRRVIGEKFIRIFESQAMKLGSSSRAGTGAIPPRAETGTIPKYLVQGTIYPDVVESAAPEREKAARIKTHHNVAGLPSDMQLSLVEPLRYLFKDEVRAVGEALGLPESLVWRQPFPGPGLAVRCLGEVTVERVACLRQADAILTREFSAAGLIGKGALTSQAFAVLLPVRSVGVMGDERTYQEVCAIRAVVSDDFMTADWARLPNELLAAVANRIVNEVHGINRVVYDITSKPPATIEWE